MNTNDKIDLHHIIRKFGRYIECEDNHDHESSHYEAYPENEHINFDENELYIALIEWRNAWALELIGENIEVNQELTPVNPQEAQNRLKVALRAKIGAE